MVKRRFEVWGETLYIFRDNPDERVWALLQARVSAVSEYFVSLSTVTTPGGICYSSSPTRFVNNRGVPFVFCPCDRDRSAINERSSHPVDGGRLSESLSPSPSEHNALRFATLIPRPGGWNNYGNPSEGRPWN